MGWLIFQELKSAVKAQKCELAEVLKDDLKDSEHMGSKRFASTFMALSLKPSSF